MYLCTTTQAHTYTYTHVNIHLHRKKKNQEDSKMTRAAKNSHQGDIHVTFIYLLLLQKS